MSTFRIFAYNRGSKGAQNLRDELRELGHRAYTYDRNNNVHNARSLNDNILINWGSSQTTSLISAINGERSLFPNDRYMNGVGGVANAVNKLHAFGLMQAANVRIPDYTSDILIASGWIDNRNAVVCRETLTGHSGEGIVIADTREQLIAAPLYTKYIKKIHEYRVHVFQDTIVDIQQKRRRVTDEPQVTNSRVRNLAGGWVYTRGNLDLVTEGTEHRTRIETQAKRAISALGLDFGAVDIIYNARLDTFYVLEVNTATGIEGTTAQNYARAFSDYAATL
jgi:glutathione synthase/RimK-type ligase-like ATP-grasp enzyme